MQVGQDFAVDALVWGLLIQHWRGLAVRNLGALEQIKCLALTLILNIAGPRLA